MGFENYTKFGSTDFEGLAPLEAAQVTRNLLYQGAAAMVEKQDWLVDRLAPPFIPVSELIRYISDLPGEPTVVHLGMGDGSANEHYKRHARNHVSYSFADRIYIDPRDLIAAFIDNETGQESTSNPVNGAVAAVLRSELLIPASITDVTSGAGMESKFALFDEKDSNVRRVRARNLADALKHGRPESFGNLTTLTAILAEKPELLLPGEDEFSRHISPLGRNLHQVTPMGQDERLLIRDIRHRIRKFFPPDPRAVSEIMFARLQRMLSNCDHIIRDDFRNAQTHFGPDSGITINLAEGSRSDAFLHGDVYSFMQTMCQALDKDNGLYISDGVISSYNYRLYYQELMAFLDSLPSHLKADFYVKTTPSEELPPVYLAGIRIYAKAYQERVQAMDVKPGYAVIPSEALSKDPHTIKQMAWTFIYDKIEDFNHRQGFDYLDVDSVPPTVIDAVVKAVSNKFGSTLFTAIENAEARSEIETFIEDYCLQEIRRSRSALIMV